MAWAGLRADILVIAWHGRAHYPFTHFTCWSQLWSVFGNYEAVSAFPHNTSVFGYSHATKEHTIKMYIIYHIMVGSVSEDCTYHSWDVTNISRECIMISTNQTTKHLLNTQFAAWARLVIVSFTTPHSKPAMKRKTRHPWENVPELKIIQLDYIHNGTNIWGFHI